MRAPDNLTNQWRTAAVQLAPVLRPAGRVRKAGKPVEELRIPRIFPYRFLRNCTYK
jgi:hypothetical protein